MIGDWYNPIDDASAVVGAAADITTSAIDTIPGGQDVRLAVDSAVTGPVRDFANTAVGRTMLSALASTVTGGLAPVLGPQLATIAFALPGMAAGDDFVTAWTQEFGKRVEQTAAIVGASYAGPLVQEQLSKAQVYLDQLKAAGVDPATVGFQEFAKNAGVSDWTAAVVLDGYRGVIEYGLNLFNITTGALRDVSGISLTSGAARQSLENLQNQLRIANAVVGTGAGSAVHSYSLSSGTIAPTRAATPAPTAVRGTAPTPTTPGSNTTLEIAIALGAVVLLGGAAAYYYLRK